MLRDILEITPSGKWSYLEGQNYDFLSSERRQKAATVYFAWGDARNVRTVFGEQFWTKKEYDKPRLQGQLRNVLLHPVIEWQGKAIHFSEEILNGWWSLNTRGDLESVVEELLAAMRLAAAAKRHQGPPCVASSIPCNLPPAEIPLSPRWMATPQWTEDSMEVNQSAEVPYRQSNVIGYVDRGGGPTRRNSLIGRAHRYS